MHLQASNLISRLNLYVVHITECLNYKVCRSPYHLCTPPLAECILVTKMFQEGNLMIMLFKIMYNKKYNCKWYALASYLIHPSSGNKYNVD